MSDRLVLLDSDRVEADLQSGRDAKAMASKLGLEIIFQDPNLEGLLLRLHDGYERRRVMKGAVNARLRRVWPDYRKPPTQFQLSGRFGRNDLRRAAQHDQDLQRLLDILGL